ncbi:MAG TPA: hypothetical protein VMD52_05485 [Patescibacteria group bacterium]|nr:hypothetical protein [Patescibacteria group bacterium]
MCIAAAGLAFPVAVAYPAAADPRLMRMRKAATQQNEQVSDDKAGQSQSRQAGTESITLPNVDFSAAGMPPIPQQAIPPAGEDANVDLIRIINGMKTSSKGWLQIADPKKREMVVYYFITEDKDKGIKINKPALHYRGMIDGMAAQTPDMLNLPFEQVLQIVAILEYDFDNGQDKDAMARKILGEEEYQKNKKRLGL